MEQDTLSIKEDMAEVKDTVKKIETTVTELRVLVAGEYVRRQELEDFKKEHVTTHNSLIGWIVGTYALVVSSIVAFFSIHK